MVIIPGITVDPVDPPRSSGQSRVVVGVAFVVTGPAAVVVVVVVVSEQYGVMNIPLHPTFI